jgi:hypothetical protein
MRTDPKEFAKPPIQESNGIEYQDPGSIERNFILHDTGKNLKEN